MALLLALLLVAVAGGGVGWLHVSGRLEPLLSGTPRIVVEINPPTGTADETKTPSPAESAGTASETAAATTSSPSPTAELPAWRRYGRPFPAAETRPRIAIVVTGLGLGEATTTTAIEKLPPEITLAFSPYADRLGDWIARARAAGHEVMLDLPMEPHSYPQDDPGPEALLTSLDEAENRKRLDWVLGRAEGYVGVSVYMGSRFITSAEHMRPLLGRLAERGLMFLDSRSSAESVAARLASELKVPRAISDRFLDNEASRPAIEGRLQQLERLARTSGTAVGMTFSYPVTLERLHEWAKTLPEKGLVLAPISAVADRQPNR